MKLFVHKCLRERLMNVCIIKYLRIVKIIHRAIMSHEGMNELRQRVLNLIIFETNTNLMSGFFGAIARRGSWCPIAKAFVRIPKLYHFKGFRTCPQTTNTQHHCELALTKHSYSYVSTSIPLIPHLEGELTWNANWQNFQAQ